MSTFLHEPGQGETCGSPACALGWYAWSRKFKAPFKLNKSQSDEAESWFESAKDHFGLSEPQMFAIFGSQGCDQAKTPIQAARYIERFVADQEAVS